MEISKKLDKLKVEVYEKYNDLISNTNIKFHSIESEDKRQILNDILESDTLDDLPNIYYNNSNGVEVEAYVLEISKEDGIMINPYGEDKIKYIGFSEINGIENQISLIEAIIQVVTNN